MADALIGSWDYESVEGLNEYMAAAGMPDEMKEMARNSKPKMVISKDGDNWVIKTMVGEKELETNFPVGKVVDTVNLMGKPIKTQLDLTDSGLVEIQKTSDLEVVIERTVVDGIFIAKMTVKGVTATAKFKKSA